MIDYFADLWKDDMIEKIRHPETNSLKYMGVWCWAQIKLIINLLLGEDAAWAGIEKCCDMFGDKRGAWLGESIIWEDEFG